jgi:hypothetical protein
VARSTSNGPEKKTLIERFVEVFHIPYNAGSLVLSIIFGPLGAILSVYLHTNNLDEAISKTIYLFFGMKPELWQSIIGLGLLFVILYFFLYMIRYMRLKLVAAEQQVLPILPKGEETFHDVFGKVSRHGPPLLIDIILISFFLLQSFPTIPENFVYFGTDPANLVFLVVAFPIWFLIFGTFAWVYFSSIRGLYELGKTSLELRSFHEDRMLGVRPMGSLSLSLAFTYFTGLGILALMPIVMSPNPSAAFYVILLSALTLLGVFFFFLPLNAIHRKMVNEKKLEQKALGEKLIEAINSQNTFTNKGAESSLAEVKEILINLTKVLTIDTTKEEVANIPTWPFDTQILSRLSAIIFSVTAILIANFILGVLR